MTPLPISLSTFVQVTPAYALIKQSFLVHSSSIMNPDKRSTSPTNPPQWIDDLFEEMQQFHNDFRDHSLALRELRIITLENQQLLRDLVGATNQRTSNIAESMANFPPNRMAHNNGNRSTSSVRQISSHAPRASSSVQRNANGPIRGNPTSRTSTSTHSTANSSVANPPARNNPAEFPSNTNDPTVRTSSFATRSNQTALSSSQINRSRPTVRPPSTYVTARNQATLAVRNSAVPMPRVEPPGQQAITRACWFHRQFGVTSAKCLPPCGFVATVPAAPAAPADNIPAVPADNIPAVPIDNAIVQIVNNGSANDIPAATISENPPEQPNSVETTTDQMDQDPVVQQISAITIRPPLERNAATKRLSSTSSSSESDPSPSTSKQFKPADWNKLAKKESVSTSSSDSDSDENC